eukprot:10324254-Ditylum_brightwellii.AAC.1
MKNKTIQEGCKFFALTTTEGFLVNFTHDGRSVAKSGRQEYELNKIQGQSERETDTDMKKFCVTMDNYFTCSHVIKHLRINRIGAFGTARMRKEWPPPGLRNMLKTSQD